MFASFNPSCHSSSLFVFDFVRHEYRIFSGKTRAQLNKRFLSCFSEVSRISPGIPPDLARLEGIITVIKPGESHLISLHLSREKSEVRISAHDALFSSWSARLFLLPVFCLFHFFHLPSLPSLFSLATLSTILDVIY